MLDLDRQQMLMALTRGDRAQQHLYQRRHHDQIVTLNHAVSVGARGTQPSGFTDGADVFAPRDFRYVSSGEAKPCC
jgi:hypothetical protein